MNKNYDSLHVTEATVDDFLGYSGTPRKRYSKNAKIDAITGDTGESVIFHTETQKLLLGHIFAAKTHLLLTTVHRNVSAVRSKILTSSSMLHANTVVRGHLISMRFSCFFILDLHHSSTILVWGCVFSRKATKCSILPPLFIENFPKQ